ncbi:MAG: VWA domain-containing protein [Phycisphaeraceae bacterium]|nr:VWA domain-containing protein [Phycisphaeraceae bacterium]MCW5754643.1 VWA domain-containing protein [Phycisphaeraceae bacterium]
MFRHLRLIGVECTRVRVGLAAWVVALCAAVAFGQPAATHRNIVVPQSRVIVAPDHTKPIRLTVVSASVSINEQVASTTLRMTLHNPSSRVQEAEVLMPVPDGSAVRFFQLEGLGGDGGARLLPRDEARRIYEGIVRQMQDPAILEFAGYGFIRSNVFPVPAGGTQTIVLSYEQLLDYRAGRLDYFLPRTQSLAETGIEWRIDLDIRSSRPIAAIHSPTHELSITQAGDRRTGQVTDPHEPGSLSLSIMLADGNDLAATLLAYPDPKVAADGRGGYLLLLAGLPPLEANERVSIKREVTVVLDRSGSMRGEKIAQARAAVLQVIEALHDGEYFNIIDYSDTISAFARRPVEKSAETVAQARAYVANIQAIGGTNIHDALVEALRQPPTPEALPVVLFLTDGLPTIGQTREVAIREAARKGNLHDRRIFTFGVGYDVNAPLLTAIARQSRATSTFVLPEEDVEVKVGEVFARLSGPILASPKVTIGSVRGGMGVRTHDALPHELPDVFEGDQLSLVSRYFGDGPISVRIEGEYFGQEKVFEFTFDLGEASTRYAFVPRLWAMRKIAALIEEIRLAGADGGLPTSRPRPVDPRFKELVDEIVRLSLEFGVLTEYTAFLADEDGLAGLPAAAAPREIGLLAGRRLTERAVRERAGAGGVAQEMNNNDLAFAPQAKVSNRYLNDDMAHTEVLGCQVASDKALFRRGARWVDGRIYAYAFEEPEEIVEFGSDRYFEIVSMLAAENRQALVCNRGEALVEVGGRRVLVRNPL